MSDKRLIFQTLYKINMPVYHYGLKPFQWILIVSIVFATWLLASWFAIFLTVPIVMVVKKIYEENAKGNPDYVESYFFLWTTMKKRFVDTRNLMKKVTNESKRVK